MQEMSIIIVEVVLTLYDVGDRTCKDNRLDPINAVRGYRT